MERRAITFPYTKNVPLSLQEKFAGVVMWVEGVPGRQVKVLFDGLLSENFSKALSEAFKMGEKDSHTVK